ncbi:PspA/IM30 family protein [Prauserella cavernicola]|uniref:PspA/IM30 family protein n=1 Tax=Prauserella cavernicola TaxID=2800127 RepID=A0A934QNS7_9PSEU|nr:PspA/IM30 family protein [Prauserella cavernicola]MBK1783905.1 PspA/IM30 family protein [Prauserella cavernicola]
MGIARRIALLFRVKANKTLDRAEDPREVLDYSYQRQVEMLAKVRRSLADVATSRKRVELQIGQARQSTERLQDQAVQALGMGKEDLAREALTRRSSALSQIDQLQPQAEALQAEEDKLTVAAQRLQGKVEAFRTRKETIKATYTAAEAQTKIGEAVSGISEEMGDVGLAMQRAEDKTAQMSSRAQALDELMASGALDDAALPVGQQDDIQAALEQSRGGQPTIDSQLAQLRAQLPSASPPAQLETGTPTTREGDEST